MSRRIASALIPALALVLLGSGTAGAATPASGSLTAPDAGGEASSTSWKGSAPVGTKPTSECTAGPTTDAYALTYTPSGQPGSTTLTFSATWKPVTADTTSDLVLTVTDAKGTALGSSDGSTTTESVSLTDPPAGTYTALVCGYVNAQSQPYDGTATATTTPSATSGPPKPVFTTTEPGPSPEVPEVPLPVLLPLLGAAVGVVVVRRLRHRAA